MMTIKKWMLALVASAVCLLTRTVTGSPVEASINYEAFLGNHDMTWNRIPNRGEVAPYTGNGNVGFTFYQAQEEAKNVISIHAGRHDYYDHRLPHEGEQCLWIYRCRLRMGGCSITLIEKLEGEGLVRSRAKCVSIK